MQFEQINQHISDRINVLPGMKLSVVWVQLRSAIDSVVPEIAKWNGALSKTFPEMKKQEVAKFFNATKDGKYIKFSDGSEARY